MEMTQFGFYLIFSVPLSQLQATGEIDEATEEAMEDWHYWAAREYQQIGFTGFYRIRSRLVQLQSEN